MIELSRVSDYVTLITLAAVAGMIGGLVADLLLVREKRSGLIDLPQRVPGGMFDLGTIASLIIGAVAAVAAMYLFPPETVTVEAADGSSTTVMRYEIVKLLALSLIVGSAGSAFLAAAQARVLAAAKEQQVEDVKNVADAELEGLAAAVGGPTREPGAAVPDSVRERGLASTDATELRDRIEGARHAIRAASRRT